MSAFNPPTYYFSGIQFNPSFFDESTSGTTNTFSSGILTNSVDTIDVLGVLELGKTRAEIVNIKNGQITSTINDTSVDKVYIKTGTGGQATIDTDTAIPLHIAPSIAVEPSAICSGVVIGNTTIPVTINGTTITLSNLKTDTITGKTGGVTPLTIGSNVPAIDIGYYTSGVNFTVTKVFGRLAIAGGQGSIETSSGTDLDIGSVTENVNLGYSGSGTNIKGYLLTNFLDRRTSGVLPIGTLPNTTGVSMLKPLTLTNPLTLGSAPTADTQLGFITSGSFTTPLSSFSADKNVATLTIPQIGVYSVCFSFQANWTSAPTKSYIDLLGTALPLPNLRFGPSSLIVAGAFTIAGSFFISVTTVGTIILRYNITGTVNNVESTNFQAVRIG